MWNGGHWGGGFCNGSFLGGFGPGFLGWILPILFWGLIIFGVVTLIKYLFRKNDHMNNPTALDILKRRYAAGEITHQEFSEMKANL